MQIPCGFFFDRFGPRCTVVGMLIIAAIGGALFTLAPNWPVLLTGRVLMGAGFGVMLIGSMVVISRWFPPDRFSTLTAMVLSIGLLGNLAATTPLGLGSQEIGWRAVFGAVRRLHRARDDRGLAGGARRAARPSLPGPQGGAATARCCRACSRCCATRA